MGPTKTHLAILVVDDNPGIRRTVKAFLDRGGYTTIDDSGSPRAILERTAPRRYHVIFLDVDLPHDVTIERAHRMFQERFPRLELNHDQILADLGKDPSRTVDGRYLLALAKAAQPRRSSLRPN